MEERERETRCNRRSFSRQFFPGACKSFSLFCKLLLSLFAFFPIFFRDLDLPFAHICFLLSSLGFLILSLRLLPPLFLSPSAFFLLRSRVRSLFLSPQVLLFFSLLRLSVSLSLFLFHFLSFFFLLLPSSFHPLDLLLDFSSSVRHQDREREFSSPRSFHPFLHSNFFLLLPHFSRCRLFFLFSCLSFFPSFNGERVISPRRQRKDRKGERQREIERRPPVSSSL